MWRERNRRSETELKIFFNLQCKQKKVTSIYFARISLLYCSFVIYSKEGERELHHFLKIVNALGIHLRAMQGADCEKQRVILTLYTF